MTLTGTIEVLGGAAVLGKAVQSEPEFVRQVEEGLPTLTIRRLQQYAGLTDRDFAEFIPRRTLHDIKQKKRLSRDQSDRVARAARVTALARYVFDDHPEAAAHWLRTPNAALESATPLSMLKTGSGASLVETVLQRIDYGVYE